MPRARRLRGSFSESWPDKGRFDRIVQTLIAEDKRFADKLEELRNPPVPHFRWHKTRGNGYPSWSPRNW